VSHIKVSLPQNFRLTFFWKQGFDAAAIETAATCGTAAILYFLTAKLLRVSEAEEALAMINRRLKR
jgi:hypothetical protein